MLLANMGHLDLDEKEIEAIAQRTEGWVTGIILTAQTSLTDSVRDILHIVGSNEGVFDYLAEEILSQQTHEVQEFLLATSLFQQMTPSLCNALLDIDQSSQILRYLVEENLFTVSLDAGSKWYEYHQLFREFLRTRLEREDPELFRALCLKQAQLVSTQGDWRRPFPVISPYKPMNKLPKPWKSSFKKGSSLAIMPNWTSGSINLPISFSTSILDFCSFVHV